MVDTPFTTFAFNATGGSTPKTMPDRLADMGVNVKDFGATGNGSTDDSAAIQAAITYSGAEGIVFFPPGIYNVGTTGIDLYSSISTSVTLRGSGQKAGVIGNVNGFIFSNTNAFNNFEGAVCMENIAVVNTHAAGGCVNIETGITVDIHNCSFNGFVCVALGKDDAVNDQSTGTMIRSCHFASPSASWAAGSMAIYCAALDTTIMNCTMLGFDQAVRICGVGHTIISCQMESNNYGLVVGRNYSNATYRATGVAVMGCSFENNFHAAIYVDDTIYMKVESTIITFGDNVLGRHSETGITVNNAQKLTIDTTVTGGAFTTAGINMLNVDSTNISKVLFINSDCGSLNIAAGTQKSNMTQINCVNFGSFATTVTLLPGNAGSPSEPPSQGDRRFVTDATATTFLSTVAGGGGNAVPVIYNGSAWIIA